MNNRTLSIIAGISYLVIFFSAIYANFFVLELILKDPLLAVEQHGMSIRFGILAFLIAAVFDVFVAWALNELYKSHPFSIVSTYFRVIHAVVMAVAVFALPLVFMANTGEEILRQVEIFNIIWLIGLFFFGVHLIFLSCIVKHIKVIPFMLMLAGVMYMVDTGAHFLLPNYDSFAGIFLALVAIPSILGEMAFTIWLLVKGGKKV